ncbi:MULTISPECIES: YhgE/Pip domain-containing protein [unclassified Paenibacillus]|uniref:YhgE/Pip domain-containing protein n=1 Tax=unclassified Paenibacillus TaxID=185978 RepID=UPI001C11ABE3|nr:MULTISPECIES: YhgE/Pip domain-containing protein [unclassified Paenibacillus]MBU5441187.1 YhgE/Pip domain-containing protein [Paenibacillus sp. MSJ-34]CAH0120488.1 hypothetical protein PAE9249_03007 [Paenibacillus sp. CECT 9249]
MKNIWFLYITDLKHIVRNWAAAVILSGLAILPSLYAWFNIEASWDPYGNTRGIAIAVANNDRGATILDRPINIGKEIVASLRENRQIGWTFVDEEEALSGVKHGTYYASIVIPEEFSGRIATVLSNEPVKAEIFYYVNEKINAVAPKITSKGASNIIDQVSSNFVKTANGAIFRAFNELGVELKNELPTIEKVKNLVFRLEASFPEINRTVSTALNDVTKANQIVGEAQANLPAIVEIGKKAENFSRGLSQLLGYSREGVEAISPYIKQDLGSLQQTALAMAQVASILRDANTDPSLAVQVLDQAARRLGTAITLADGLSGWFDRLNRYTPGAPFTSVTNKLQQIRTRLEQQQTIAAELKDAIGRGEAASAELVDRFERLAEETAALTGDLLDRYDREIKPKVLEGLGNAKNAVDSAQSLLAGALARVPDADQILKDASRILAIGQDEIAAIQKELPFVQAKIKDIADKMRALQARGEIEEIISLLKHNFEKESEFFAEPVVLKETKLYPIPNYGSAMSPFFTTLSLWVGALLLVSLLTVDVHNGSKPFTNVQIYFGRYFTFATIALLQALFVTLGDIYLLGAYVLNKIWFIGFGLLLSLVFMLIVYTLVSVFGNVGKAMAIVLLVLQLAGSGGTFPIQVTPPFFQAIYPYLPFTYAISMMREAVGGILWDIVWRDLIMMAVYAGIALVIGLALKTPINKASARFVRKAKESGLIH